MGTFLHSTETLGYVAPHAQGSWHYLIDRNGTITRFVEERDIAWHVARCDEHWPAWLPPTSGGYQVSAANYQTIGVELVSHATYRAAGEPYTDAQYHALHALLADVTLRRGMLPVDAHGRVQLDRTDPVAFDYVRAGLVWDGAADAHFYRPEPVEDPNVIAELQAQIAALRAEIDGLNGVNTSLAEQLAHCQALKTEVEHTLTTQLGQTQAALGVLQERINELVAQLGQPAPSRAAVRIVYDNGTAQEIAV